MHRIEEYLPHLPVIPYVAYLTEAGRQIDFVGPSVEHILGYTPDEFTVAMNNLGIHVHADDVQHMDDMRVCLLDENRDEYTCEYRFRHAKGHYVWLADAGRVVRDESGTIQHLVGSLMDISDRKQAEREVVKVQERFVRALDGTSIIFTEQSTDLRYEWVFNPQNGFDQEPLIGRRSAEFLDSEQSRVLDDLSRRVIQTAQAEKKVLALHLPNGDRPVVDIHVKPRFAADGTVDGVTTTSYVVTELFDTREKLRESENRMRLALRDSPITLFIQDVQGRYTWLENPQFSATAADIIGKMDDDLFPPDIADQLRTLREQVLATKTSVETELEMHLPQGHYWYSVHIDPVLDDQNNVKELAFVVVNITEQVERERQFKLLANNSRDMICLHAPDGTYEYVSPAVEQLLGYTPEDLLGENPYNYFHPDDQERIREESHEQMLAGNPYTKIEYRIRQQSGGYIWFETLSQPLLDEQGTVTGLMTTSRDVTARRALQEQIREQRDRLRFALEDSPITISVQDTNGRYLWIENNQLGLPDEDIIGKTDYDLLPQDFANEFEQFRKQVIASKTTGRLETVVEIPGGRRSYVLRAQPTLDSDGDVKNVVFIAVDNTDQVERERLFKLLAENSADMIALHAPDGTYRYISPAVEKLLGYTPEELIGTDPAHLVHPEDAGSLNRDSTPLLWQGKTVKPPEFRIQKKNGEYIWFDASLQPIIEDSTFVGITTTARDVTAKVQLRQQLDEQRRSLAESNKELEQFAYVASHDLQEPLRAVTGYLNLLRQLYAENLDDEALDFLNEAVEGSERMRALINGLLEYSRVNRKNQPFAMVAIQDVLDDALANLHTTIQERNVQVTQDDMPFVAVDSIQLTRVFQNLIGNAIKFTDKPTITVHIGAVNKKQYWQFSVQDNGMGIDPAYYDRIFTIFQRLHTRDEIPGTGIGLAVVRKIIERHGGKIWLESTPGEGTTFYFTVRKDLQRTREKTQ